MATDFIIKKGRSTVLFDENGACKISQEKLIVNGWYLTTDTAEVYVCLEFDGVRQLKKLNECNTDIDFPELDSFEERLTALEDAKNEDNVESIGYRAGFPEQGILNRLYIANDEKRTYIYTKNGYLPIADQFDTIDHDEDKNTPEVRIIFGGTAD